MVCVAILNWNNYQDTIECLRSLNQIDYEDYFVVVGDNGSSNNSLDKIAVACEELLVSPSIIKLDIEEKISIKQRSVILYDLKENHGFAKGNNLIVKYASRYTPDYYLLLNNDTVVEPDFLSKLINYQKKNPDYKVLTPLIYYFFDKHLIWNAGGDIYWGLRKYHYANKTAKEIVEETNIPCTYVTGCAMLVTSHLIANNSFLTERFFHGEEDFDFSLRMKENKVKMTCVLNSRIYHKVSTATKKFNHLGKIYIHYLSRFIDMRSHMGPISYFFWEKLYALYIAYLLHRAGVIFSDIRRLIYKICSESKKKDAVTKEYFFKCLNSHNLLNDI